MQIPDEIWKGKTSLCSSIATRNPPCGFRIKHPAGIALLRLINGHAGKTLSRCPGHLSTPHNLKIAAIGREIVTFAWHISELFPFFHFFGISINPDTHSWKIAWQLFHLFSNIAVTCCFYWGVNFSHFRCNFCIWFLCINIITPCYYYTLQGGEHLRSWLALIAVKGAGRCWS